MTIATPTTTSISEVQSTSKPQGPDDRISAIWDAVHDLEGAIADLVGALNDMLTDQDIPEGVRELALVMRQEAEEVLCRFGQGDFFGQLENLEELAAQA